MHSSRPETTPPPSLAEAPGRSTGGADGTGDAALPSARRCRRLELNALFGEELPERGVRLDLARHERVVPVPRPPCHHQPRGHPARGPRPAARREGGGGGAGVAQGGRPYLPGGHFSFSSWVLITSSISSRECAISYTYPRPSAPRAGARHSAACEWGRRDAGRVASKPAGRPLRGRRRRRPGRRRWRRRGAPPPCRTRSRPAPPTAASPPGPAWASLSTRTPGSRSLPSHTQQGAGSQRGRCVSSGAVCGRNWCAGGDRGGCPCRERSRR